jgi:23S rRNA pseudouridine1911/1915/1917 synthase
MDIKIIYEDENLLVVDKPAGVVVFPEGATLKNQEKTLIDYLTEKFPELKNAGETPRYGIVHRLDKDTSGILLVAKNTEALIFLQKQFINTSVLSASLGNKNCDSSSLTLLDNRRVEKKYTALATGFIREEKGEIKTLIGRAKGDKRKQKAYPLTDISLKGLREAITDFKVIKRFEDYTLLEVQIKTGRRHQIRCHLSYLKHPIAGDKLYGFKNQPTPEGLTRQFLHASYLKIQLPPNRDESNGKTEEFKSELPEELKTVLEKLKEKL